jgi:uncharacterized protein YjiS (DUF1127 family)
MNERHNEFQHYVAQAHEARAEAMARSGYLAVAALGRAVQAVGVGTSALTGGTLRALADWRRRQAAAHELSRLDDRMLRDIGITRADIWAVADGTLRSRTEVPEIVEPLVDRDIAFTTYALGGCNDNDRRRAA